MRKVVANTTPLIALADIGQLELLHHLYGEILIPAAVMDEIESEPARTLVTNADWIKQISINDPEKTPPGHRHKRPLQRGERSKLFNKKK